MFDYKTQKKKRAINNKSTKHTVHIKRQKILVDYRNKSFDNLRIMIVDPTPELDSEESNILFMFLVYQVKINLMKLYPRWY